MENPQETATQPLPAPKRHSFFGGVGSGLFSGALMMGLYSSVIGVASLIGLASFAMIPPLGAMALMVTTTGLFGGVMAARRAHSEPSFPQAPAAALAPAVALEPALAPQITPDPVPEVGRADGKQWTDVTGRSTSSKSTVDAILANNALSDADRASQILAARDQASKAAPGGPTV